VTNILTTIEDDASKVFTFVGKEIIAAENLLGAKTGNAKLNLVVTAAEAGLSAVGINVSNATAEVKALINSMVSLFNASGIFTTSGSGSSTGTAPAA
jgi:hypothetical protein